ncbi:hypothetical protein GGI25_001551 [Coemansia spiralis]|uniref:Uncharacterized protein n=2 Tax=Coemansia TaxID=4863 RepID=A0A9W8KYD1_9FUNG|nr:hypothetical protein EDC05_002054 [Coemansia umbellata]KAJ2622971.1 hypothetical protein GGI26_002772 [Coemansia sp. RSA 1358]KAJ2679416.1 hypothetical protein GGI25_001551 [Coemansia spiralis]
METRIPQIEPVNNTVLGQKRKGDSDGNGNSSGNGNRTSYKQLLHKEKQEHHQQTKQKQRRQLLNQDNDLPTLLDCFQFLDSPDPTPYAKVCFESDYGDIFQVCIGDGRYDGMRTQLYRYQKNSLFKILKRELLPDFFLDPNFNPLRKVDLGGQSKICHPLLPYFQFAHGFNEADNPWLYERQQYTPEASPVNSQDVSWYSDTRGGIICEDMGTGKTCECLALILLTKRQMARPPLQGEMLPCVGTVASALETDFCDLHSDIDYSDRTIYRPSVHSLKLLAGKAALLSCVESLRVMHDDGLLPIAMWRQLEPYPPYYWVNPIVEKRPRRGAGSYSTYQVSFKVYMSSSTLVVVPDNLIDQWVREKYKHIEDTGGLEMLKIDSSTLRIPEPKKLIQYDIVLMSVGRLSKEYIPIDSNISELRHLCRCYSRGLEHCVCDKRKKVASYRSPLLRVHWKRLIVDEGHIMSSRNAARSLMAAYLIAERRWVCTGTPTHNLVHATSEIFTDTQTAAIDEMDDSLQMDYSDSKGSITSQSLADKHCHGRRKYKVDMRESSWDFFQLGMLVSKFLRMDPFAQSTSLWSSIMVQPYKRDERGARGRLRALMQSIMVRNRPEAISSEVQLPSLHERVVKVAPSQLQMLTYNTVVAFFHINAILTERTGRDYFFHPENKKHLRQIVENLFYSCFWFSASIQHIKDGIENGRRALELWEKGEKPYSTKDVALLRQAISQLQHASADSKWIHSMQAESVGYYIHGLPACMQTGLHLVKETISALSPLSLPLEFPLNPDKPNIPLNGTNTLEEPAKLATADQITNITTQAKFMLMTTDDDLPPCSRNLSPREFTMLKDAKIAGCTSSKVVYIVDSVLRYHRDEKCIVFVNSQSEAIIIDDALHLARVPHLLYASHGMSQSQRRHNITTFSTSTVYNTIVMDVNLAAYGIDLSAASRVWFVSPIWQAARERQAIKRAHRLGQRSPVFVETLLTAGSIEEALWTRRQEISSDDTEVIAKGVEEDSKMCTVLSNARFIEHCGISDLFTMQMPLLPSNIRYPQLLMDKFNKWYPDSADGATNVPFFKAKRLVLRVSEPNQVDKDVEHS